jgi:transcriptional regulator with XRE-family HTH domain
MTQVTGNATDYGGSIVRRQTGGIEADFLTQGWLFEVAASAFSNAFLGDRVRPSSIYRHFPGTGGLAVADLLQGSFSGSASLIVLRSPAHENPQWRTVDELVGSIRVAFGLTVADTARVLGVERPTIYSWLRGESTPTTSNRQRIEKVFEMADIWLSQAIPGPISGVKSVASDGKSIFDLLEEPHLRAWLIGELIQSAAKQAHAGPAQRRSISSRATELGINAQRDNEQIDFLTGRRLSPE